MTNKFLKYFTTAVNNPYITMQVGLGPRRYLLAKLVPAAAVILKIK